MSEAETVVLVTADTLRFDALSAGDADAAPFLRSLADRSVEFTSAYSTGPGTSSAFPGILASSYPLDHGYRGLNENHQSVAERLGSDGVRTAGITSSSHASSLFNYDRGFDVFYENPSYRRNAVDTSSLSTTKRLKNGVFEAARSIPVVERVGATVLDAVRNARSSDDAGAPYEHAETITNQAMEVLGREFETDDRRDRFVWIHYMEPHAPYYPPNDIIDEFNTGGLTKEFVNDVWDQWKANRPTLWAEVDSSDMFTDRQRRALDLFYRIQIRYLDREVERLFDYLESTVGFENTTFLFSSDHGEEFFDHGDLGHRPKLYDELTNVPLLLYTADVDPRTVEMPVSHVDLGPTVADLLDREPAARWRGESLLPLVDAPAAWDGHDYVRSEVCHASGYGGDVDPEMAILSFVTDEWKYIRNEQTEAEELYSRPGVETVSNDHSDTEPIVKTFQRAATDRLSEISNREVEKEELSDDLREQLHDLGYIDE